MSKWHLDRLCSQLFIVTSKRSAKRSQLRLAFEQNGGEFQLAESNGELMVFLASLVNKPQDNPALRSPEPHAGGRKRAMA
ncbi:hypothetical protein [Rhizobacter sp. P5_C2]